MSEIKLTHESWKIDYSRPLGDEGGFGQVYHGEGGGQKVAIKKLKQAPRGLDERELKMASKLIQKSPKHIVPIHDYGIDPDSGNGFVVMPICELSLKDHVQLNGPMTVSGALEVIRHCVLGLEEADDIVHRDLKPGNILLSDGFWKIADFGISKAVQDPTSEETLRRALSPHYASPEQWNLEKPTRKSDIYALGGILHFALTGQTPFVGGLEDLKKAHLHHDFSAVDGLPPAVVTLVSTLTRKSPATRPNLNRVKAMLSKAIAQSKGDKISPLSSVNAKLATIRSEEETKRLLDEESRKRKEEIGKHGMIMLNDLRDELFNSILAEATEAKIVGTTITLGNGSLNFWPNQLCNVELPQWTILASSFYSIVGLISQQGQNFVRIDKEYTFKGCLFYGKKKNEEDFRWFEVGFYDIRGEAGPILFHFPPNNGSFINAFSNSWSPAGIAFGPRSIDDECFEDYRDRMISLFAIAADGKLRNPSQLPLNDSYFIYGH